MSTGPTNLLQVLQKRVETLQGEGKLEDALRVAQTAVDAARRNVSSDPACVPQLVSTLLMLADLRRMCSDFEGAENVYLEGLNLAADESVEVPNLEVARLQSGLASLYDFTSRETQAIPLYQEAIQRFEGNTPPELEESAYLCNNLAMIHKQLGDFQSAETYYLKALGVFESERGASHTSVGTVLNNLGGLYGEMDQPEKARGMHERAMAIREDIHPKNHPDLGQSLCNLATVYHQLGDFNNAKKHYDAAMRLFEKNLEEAGEDYSILMSNFAELLREHGHDAKADALEQKVRGLGQQMGDGRVSS